MALELCASNALPASLTKWYLPCVCVCVCVACYPHLLYVFFVIVTVVVIDVATTATAAARQGDRHLDENDLSKSEQAAYFG